MIYINKIQKWLYLNGYSIESTNVKPNSEWWDIIAKKYEGDYSKMFRIYKSCRRYHARMIEGFPNLIKTGDYDSNSAQQIVDWMESQ